MVSTEIVDKILESLVDRGVAQVDIYGHDVNAQIFDEASKLMLSTKVYHGGNYIPKSVRECLQDTPPLPSECDIETFLSLDEKNFQIQLNYIGRADLSAHHDFKNLVDCFCWVAEEWRYWIDENDKKDLLPVPGRR